MFMFYIMFIFFFVKIRLRKSVYMKSVTGPSLLCVRGGEEEEGFGQLASHHRALTVSQLLHTHRHTHAYTHNNKNIISLSSCGSLLQNQR